MNIPTATPQAVAATSRAPAGVVSGLVFYDANADGVWDAPAEPGLAGARVVIASISAGTGDSGQGWMDSQTVDASGWYTFTLPGPGTYTVYPVPPPGYRYTTAARTTFSVGERDDSIEMAALAFGLNKRVVPLLLAVLLELILALLVGVMVTGLRVREAILERSWIQEELATAHCLIEEKLEERDR